MAARGRPQPAGSSPQVQLGSSLGGPYLGVHLRRKDFIWGHRQDVPSLDGAVRRIRSLMEAHQLPKVFVATDAVRKGRPAARGGGPALPGAVPGPARRLTRLLPAELEELKRLLPEMLRFEPTWEELELYKDGGVAIIDQWICAHARSAPPGLLRLSRPRPPAPGGRLPSGTWAP